MRSVYTILLGWCPRLLYAGPSRDIPSYAFPASLSMVLLALGYWGFVGLTTIRIGLPLDSSPGGFLTYVVVQMVSFVFTRLTYLFWHLRNVKIPDIDWPRFSKWVAFQIMAIPAGVAIAALILFFVGGWPRGLEWFVMPLYVVWGYSTDRVYGSCYTKERRSGLKSASGDDLSAAFRD